MPISDDSVQAKLMEIRGLQLEHFVDATPIDSICSVSHLLCSTIATSKPSGDELFAIFVEELKGRKVGTCRDLDELGKAISNLCFGKCSKKSEI